MSHGPVPGMLTRAQLGELIERGEIETVLTVFPDMYGRLMGKRITGHFFMDHVADGGMHACDYLLACDMEMDVIAGYKYTSWETGYGDFHCVPDFATLRRAAWLPRTAMVLCDLYGRIMRAEAFEDAADSKEINLEGLAVGVYAWTFRSKAGAVLGSGKLIKMNTL